ncbi:hypothetical protein PTTG_10958 [Puccinia triticina 1-1 BBBD Race 1]|uniref:Ras-GAP domain-containing protein n=1 Tax=Puccinia triticina (isolate 1-1 / race 1 (BBBD)) TaxID=630390 RepID=A0A180H2U2_PUCT1|nr:hypothetical protein PTTG_10958 [Puccinia triticina 1-1 BBBD Race 1]
MAHHHHHHPSLHTPAGTIHSTASPNPNSTPSEDKLIDALVNKIMAKLSNQADPHLSPLETDELIRQSCSALFEMCCQRLPCVIQKLLQELDSPSHPFTSDEQTGLVDHLRTQLFVIKILCYCMSYHWAWHREQVALQATHQPPNHEHHPHQPPKPSLTDWVDPPQLDDNLAKQLVATISFFLKEHQRFEDAGAALGPIGSTSQPSANYEAHRKATLGNPQQQQQQQQQQQNSIFGGGGGGGGREPDEKPIVPSLMGDILTQVSKICFFVSASNWTIVLGKIKNRIAYWSGPEEFPDRSETRLLEFCSLNRHRLSSIVRELSAQFVHLKRAAQADIALALRRSIWNWIETYPNEYASLVRSNGRLEGAPDVLFDVAHGLSENGKKRTYTWPMMAMLLAVCPDIVLKITVGDRNRSQVTARKAAFIESLRKHLKAVKMTDVATACCVDLCKAATFSPKMTAEGPGLRLLALDLVGDLNSRLLDPSKPFTNSEGVVEIPLMSEALAALCKLDRHFVDTTLLEKCLSRTSFVPFQIAFIQACHKLASDPEIPPRSSSSSSSRSSPPSPSSPHPHPEDRSSEDEDDMANWNVKLKELYPAIASSLRHVFMSAVLETNQFHILMRSNSKLITGGDESGQKTELVRALLNLWTQDTTLAFFVPPSARHPHPHHHHHHQQQQQQQHTGRSAHELNSRLASGHDIDPDDLEMFVYLTTLLLNNRNPRPVRQAAMTVLRAYHQPSSSPRPGAELLPLGLRQARAIVGIAVLKALLETWVFREEEREVLQLLKAYLDRFKEAVEWSERGHSPGFPFASESHAHDWLVFGHLLRLAVPLGLCTVDQYNLALLLRCSKELISVFEKHPPVLRLCGLDASLSAAQLSATLQGLPDDGKGLGGRVAQAKRAKLVMRTIASNSPIIDPLWDEALRRWKLLSSLVGHRPFEDSSGDAGMYDCAPALGAISGEGVLENTNAWISISGLLTSIASLHDPSHPKPRPPPLDHFIPPDLLHDRFYALPDRARNVDRYIQEMVDLLVADDLRMREGVKDALGTELHTALFPILLKHLKSIVAHFFEHERAKPQSPFSHFIEQAISMLRLFFERIVEPLAEPVAERVAALLIDFTRYTNRLGCLGSDFGPIATRIKYKMAQLAEVIVACNKERAAPLVTSTVLKNQMIDYFLAWATSVNMVSCISAEEASRQRANRDLSIACLKALAAFYDRLKLVPRHALLRGNHTANNEVVHVRLFSRHYDYLSFLLTEVTKLEAVAVRSRKGKMAAGGGTMGGGGGTPEHAAALQRELASITREIVELAGFREQTMHCLVKLMAANIDPAFRYFVNMFHHPDNRIKQANIQILWEVVKEGGHLLPDLVKPVRPSGLDKIVDMITRPDLTLALAICKVCGSADFEEMTEVILNIFDHRKGVIKFLKASIEREVAVTDHESTVFRGNSFTTRLLTIFARAQGYDYLRNTLSNLLVGLANKPSEFSVDFDPHRASADDDEAARNLEQVTEAFLNVIAVSWKKLPCAIREICHHIATTVQEKYPESVFTSIGGFIFLRFINPAIVSPEVIDLDLPNDTREIRRSLVMITKVLQALSNNIRFSAREPAMKPLNPFMAKNVYPMTRFLKDISSIDEPGMVAEEGTELQDELAPVPLDAADRYVLHRFLYENQEKLGAELKSVRPMEFKHWHDGSERLTPTLGHEIWAEYHAFLAKYELNRPPDPRIWQALFFEAPRSRLQTMPTFVFLTSRLKAEMCDLESFYLYILQAVDAIDGPFALFLDCTGFTFANEISLPWFRQLIDASPALPALHLAQIWVYNANAIFRRYIRKLGATEKQERRWTNLVRAVSTLDELAICLPNYEQVLPASSWNMFHDKRVVISHVTHLQQYQMQIPVVLHIGSKTLLIRSSKRLELLADAKCTLNDVIRLKDIEEMQRLPPSNVHLDPGFIIKQYGSNVTMKFVSVNTDRIIETLANTQADLLSTPQNFDFRPRSLTPATIYGSLLNGAIFNLCSSDSLIRMAALSFLQGLTRALRIDKIEDVIPFQGGYIPRLGLAFISDISDRLARAVPSATFPFLDEFFITLPTASASEVAVYAHAVKSWLQNLSNCLVCPREEFEYARNRVKNILRRLIELTLCQQDLQGLLHGRIWPSLARQESLLPLIIEELAMSAITHGSNSARFTEVCEIAVSGNCINLQGKLLHRLRRAIGRTTAQPVAMISDSPEWPEITALVRMEMSISFSAHIQAQLYLPDILHIVTMLVGTGLASQRSAIYAIVINTLTCLCSLQGPNHEASALYAIIKRLGLPATQALFGLYPNDLALRYTEDDFGFREPISPVALESIVQLLIEAVKVASPAIDTINRWRSRWASLVTSTCFQANPALQPRAFVVLGYLLTEEVDDDLLFQVLSALKPALGLPSGIDRALATSIISCGAKVLAGVASNSPYRSASFWTGVTLLQLEDPAIYAAALKLTRSAVHDFCQSKILGNQRLSQFLLDSRDDGTVEVMGQIEEVCGLRFDNGEAGYVADGAIYFGFALASSMIKGLRHAQIAQDAEEFLELLLVQATSRASHEGGGGAAPGRLTPEALPYFVVLLPIAVRTAKLPQLFALAHVDRNGLDGADLAVSYGFIINQLRMSDHETALLVVAVFTTMISSADDEAELVFLYNILAELVHRDVVPHIMLLVQTELAPRVQEIMRTSENTQLLNACQAVMFPHHPRVKGSQFLARLTDGLESSDFISVLSTLGFSGLLLHNCFGDEMDDGHHDVGAGPPAGLDHLAHPSHLSSHLANGGAGREYDLKIARLCVCLIIEALAV